MEASFIPNVTYFSSYLSGPQHDTIGAVEKYKLFASSWDSLILQV